MAYVLPRFPLAVNIWRFGNPTINPPDVVTVGNLSPGRRVFASGAVVPPVGVAPLLMELLLPPLTDIRGWNAAAGKDICEVPAGSFRYYEVEFVDDIGKGFANQHRLALIGQMTPWPSPIP